MSRAQTLSESLLYILSEAEADHAPAEVGAAAAKAQKEEIAKALEQVRSRKGYIDKWVDSIIREAQAVLDADGIDDVVGAAERAKRSKEFRAEEFFGKTVKLVQQLQHKITYAPDEITGAIQKRKDEIEAAKPVSIHPGIGAKGAWESWSRNDPWAGMITTAKREYGDGYVVKIESGGYQGVTVTLSRNGKNLRPSNMVMPKGSVKEVKDAFDAMFGASSTNDTDWEVSSRSAPDGYWTSYSKTYADRYKVTRLAGDWSDTGWEVEDLATGKKKIKLSGFSAKTQADVDKFFGKFLGRK